MHPEADKLWRGPRWTLAALLAALSALGPFSIDTYLPAFASIERAVAATPVQMQQTLSAYLAGFAVMNLFHGAVSDSVGRRRVVLGAMAVFAAASVGCALSDSIGELVSFRALQGMSAGGGMVVGRAIIRDLFPPHEAQRVMSQVTVYFGVAPAVAPMIGGWLLVGFDWHAIFWFLAALGAVLLAVMWRCLPESLHPSQRQPLHPVHLLRGYWQLGSSRRFLMLALSSGIPFNGMFLYVLASPAWLGGHLGLAPTQFFWFFCIAVSGIMLGAFASGRLAGRMSRARQVGWGWMLMGGATAVNVACNALGLTHPLVAMLPVGVYSLGWALVVPVVTLVLLDLFPQRRGMASSVQSFLGAFANAAVAGVVVPLVMHSTLALALASAALMSVGLVAWVAVRRRLPSELL
ncbi:MAG: multidrug transporter CflA [Pseudomonadota bacterium]|jgi:DHA1 family bicyclomycin/chloramphenicol resistance-like MFS transporter